MKEITRIHLAATPFNIEIAAKKELEKYLEAVEGALQADSDALREIEARIIELLDERGVKGEKVITLSDVEEIEKRLGSPADFSDGEMEIAGDTQAQKRLMRDEEHGMLGGVFAGAGAYIGVHPNWLRIIAIVLAFASFGTVVLIYIVLWVALPAAHTAAEKLQMAGKPVTLASLQQEAETPRRESRIKPLIIVLRALLGFGFAAAAMIAAAMTIIGGMIGVPGLAANADIVNGWLIAALVAFILSGMLFTLLMILAAYASFTWRLTRVLGYGGIAIILAGMVVFGAGMAGAFYGANVMNNKIASLSKVEKKELPQLSGAEKIVVSGTYAPVEYRYDQGTPRAEIYTFERRGNQASVKVIRDGDVARIQVSGEQNDTPCFIVGDCSFNSSRIVIYGPALKNVEITDGVLNYEAATQPALDAMVGEGAAFTIQSGEIDSLTATVKRDGSLSADGASVNNVSVDSQNNTHIVFGVISRLDLRTPQACPAGSVAEISIERVGTLVHNGAQATAQSRIEDGCAQITITSLERESESTL